MGKNAKTIVAVVGRPNVGKSTLFNKLVGKQLSIVENTPGVTRDRIYSDANWLKHNFTVIDTGGLEPDSKDSITKQMYVQAQVAMETADVILFVTDVRQGVTDDDMFVATELRKTKKPVLLVVNKVDNIQKDELAVYEFYNLSLGDPMPISAEQGLGLGEMLDELVELFPKQSEEEEDEDVISVAIIGKPNAGKSSIVNKIIGEERVIVSDIPGTTRDAVDSSFERNGDKFVLIDTAGIRRKSKIKERIEQYSIVRAVAAIERANVAVLMIDAQYGISEQDAKIAGIAHERGKAAVIAVNKWDLIEKNDKTIYEFTREIDNRLKYMSYAPKVFISALSGQRVHKLLETVKMVNENHVLRVQTGILNDILIEAMAINQPPAEKGKQLKIYYITQASVRPPTFVLFVNSKELLHFSYRRFIENQIRQAFGFTGTPIHFVVRERAD